MRRQCFHRIIWWLLKFKKKIHLKKINIILRKIEVQSLNLIIWLQEFRLIYHNKKFHIYIVPNNKFQFKPINIIHKFTVHKIVQGEKSLAISRIHYGEDLKPLKISINIKNDFLNVLFYLFHQLLTCKKWIKNIIKLT